MRDYQVAAGETQDREVLFARLGYMIKDKKVEATSVRNLRTALSLWKGRAIASFLARVEDLYTFNPSLVAAGRN
jgi:hypothetical protein